MNTTREVKRLEDLTPELQTVFKQTVASSNVRRIIEIATAYDRELERLGLFELTRIDHHHSQISLTAEGWDLWTDYQQRQGANGAASATLELIVIAGNAADREAELGLLVKQGQKIKAIKLYREIHAGVGLHEAIQAIDKMLADRPPRQTYEQLEAELAKARADLQAAQAIIVRAGEDMQALRAELLALKVENRRVWDGFSILSQVVGFEPTDKKVYLTGTVAGRSLLTDDTEGEYTMLYGLAQEFAEKKVKNGWAF